VCDDLYFVDLVVC